MSSRLIKYFLVVSSVIWFGQASQSAQLSCRSTDPNGEIEALDLASDSKTIRILRSNPIPRVPLPYLKIENVSIKNGITRILGEHIQEGVGCAGGCGTTRFELIIDNNQKRNNSTLVLTSSSWNENTGKPMIGKREISFDCE